VSIAAVAVADDVAQEHREPWTTPPPCASPVVVAVIVAVIVAGRSKAVCVRALAGNCPRVVLLALSWGTGGAHFHSTRRDSSVGTAGPGRKKNCTAPATPS
jgi:hypothetical protein